jgi:hypothetical protein
MRKVVVSPSVGRLLSVLPVISQVINNLSVGSWFFLITVKIDNHLVLKLQNLITYLDEAKIFFNFKKCNLIQKK